MGQGSGCSVVAAATIFGLGLVAGLLLLLAVVQIVSREKLLAVPDHRSSHSQPTPTMGGIAIVVVVLAYLATLTGVDARLGWTLLASLAALALIGLWDDLAPLSARVRIVVHFAAGWAVLSVLWPSAPLWLVPFALLALVWFVNLYNFMDGIDGFAAAQCLVFCVGAQLIAGGVPGWSGEALWLLSGVTLAFLAFNWPPARIFMGDVGSGFLGLLIGGLVVHLWLHDAVPLVASLILLSAFWFDATYTLCVRIVTRQDFTQAHRQHLYQHAAQRIGHLWTTAALFLYAAVWLLPWAYFAAHSDLTLQIIALVISSLPMAALCWRFAAGLPQPAS